MGIDLKRQDLGLQAVGQVEEVVCWCDAVPGGPLIDEEAGLCGLAGPPDVEGVDDGVEAELDRDFGQLRGV